MEYNLSTRNKLASAFGALYNGGTLQIRTAADGVLGVITLPNPAFAAPSAGAVAKTGTWSDNNADASGTAAKAVFISADGNDQAAVSVGIAGSGAEMIINSVNIIQGGTIVVNTYTYTVPAF